MATTSFDCTVEYPQTGLRFTLRQELPRAQLCLVEFTQKKCDSLQGQPESRSYVAQGQLLKLQNTNILYRQRTGRQFDYGMLEKNFHGYSQTPEIAR
jgi:hypothetical protein